MSEDEGVTQSSAVGRCRPGRLIRVRPALDGVAGFSALAVRIGVGIAPARAGIASCRAILANVVTTADVVAAWCHG